MTICVYCSSEFATKSTLKRHLVNKRCTFKVFLEDGEKAFEFIEKLNNIKMGQVTPVTTNAQNIHNGSGNINIINVNLTVTPPNPVNKLNVDYIVPEKMKDLVEEYNYPKLGYLLSNYIKDMIHNKDHPENHSVKYIKKKPPTFQNTIENDEGETINVIKNLKDSCELLSEPVLANLKQKLRQCKKVFKNDADFQNVYEDTVREIYKELNKDVVKKALSTVLQTDILNDIQMKIDVIKKKNSPIKN
jgi:hypothetical protein